MQLHTIDHAQEDAPRLFATSLKHTGFAVLKNHPIPVEQIQDVYTDWVNFFQHDSKVDYLFDNDNQDGYFPFLSENAKGSAVKDLKEFYHLYPNGRYPESIGPSTKNLFNQLLHLSIELLSWVQDNSPKEVTNLFSEPLPGMVKKSERNLLRILHYPPLDGSEETSAIRAAEHEDINLITLLVTGTHPGLQVKDSDETWNDVPCDFGMLVVNCGDMLQEASGSFYPSTPHRVINPGNLIQNQSRYTMPFFVHPRDDVKLSDSYTAGQYLEERLKETGVKD